MPHSGVNEDHRPTGDPFLQPGAPRSRAADRSRRDVLRLAAGAVTAAVGTRWAASSQDAAGSPEKNASELKPAAAVPAAATGPPSPWWMGDAHPRSRVIDIRAPHVLNASVADEVALVEVITQGIQALTFTDKPADAWRRILGPSQRIVLKFNSVAAARINTSGAMARALLESLNAAGYPPALIAGVETPEHIAARFETRKPAEGWGPEIAVGGGRESLAAWVYEADAIINVPFLKTHPIAGMTCCCKNISHAVVRRPARYHSNGCAPFVGEILGSEPVTARLKVNIVNAIRTVVNRGPDAAERDVYPHGGLLLGFDPVATDAVGLDLLLRQRREYGLSPDVEVRYLQAARTAGIGRLRPTEIDRAVIEAGT